MRMTCENHVDPRDAGCKLVVNIEAVVRQQHHQLRTFPTDFSTLADIFLADPE